VLRNKIHHKRTSELSKQQTMAEDDNNKRYKQYLTQFMSFRDGWDYDADDQFTALQLSEITPIHQLVQWMCVKAYGIPNLGPADDNPTQGHLSSLEYYKKALSYYMPHRIQPWNSITMFGNPTRSAEVNNLIKMVKKKEVRRRQGKSSQARRALEPEEFEQLIDLIEENPHESKRYLMSALNRFQSHMIARIDDTTKFYVEDLKANTQFNFAFLPRCVGKKTFKVRGTAQIRLF
jgi:hypothetical protein